MQRAFIEVFQNRLRPETPQGFNSKAQGRRAPRRTLSWLVLVAVAAILCPVGNHLYRTYQDKPRFPTDEEWEAMARRQRHGPEVQSKPELSTQATP